MSSSSETVYYMIITDNIEYKRWANEWSEYEGSYDDVYSRLFDVLDRFGYPVCLVHKDERSTDLWSESISFSLDNDCIKLVFVSMSKDIIVDIGIEPEGVHISKESRKSLFEFLHSTECLSGYEKIAIFTDSCISILIYVLDTILESPYLLHDKGIRFMGTLKS